MGIVDGARTANQPGAGLCVRQQLLLSVYTSRSLWRCRRIPGWAHEGGASIFGDCCHSFGALVDHNHDALLRQLWKQSSHLPSHYATLYLCGSHDLTGVGKICCMWRLVWCHEQIRLTRWWSRWAWRQPFAKTRARARLERPEF